MGPRRPAVYVAFLTAFLAVLLAVALAAFLVVLPAAFLVVFVADDYESGSASGSMTAVQQIDGALGVAVLGTVFFGHVDGGTGSRTAIFGAATQVTTWVAIGAVAIAFALTFLLPKRTREGAPAHA
ncbi:hypothetical protein HJ588_15290 [Flexivirga sp. ID2601S]|uniref:MFS transporter n=1 Tax=Flexivirga aerilata TaxID=1656889 RepID=A0A849AJT7_9MICO|nr:hypothetical protein [Flexivirga aerilata]NNG40629.1 hypothetical protein [Flexivirga aerilata]